MSDLNTNPDLKEDGNDPEVLSPEEMKAELEKLRIDLAKERGIRKNVQKERDELKKNPKKDEGNENYKDLYQKELTERQRLAERVKSKEINSSVKDQLLSIGILPGAVEAAVKLADSSLIAYDDDTGVDSFSAETAAKALKAKFPFMFETKINNSKNRLADNGKDAETKEIKRADFFKLDPVAQAKKMKEGFKVID